MQILNVKSMPCCLFLLKRLQISFLLETFLLFQAGFNEDTFEGTIIGTVSEDLNTFDDLFESNIFSNYNFTAQRYN